MILKFDKTDFNVEKGGKMLSYFTKRFVNFLSIRGKYKNNNQGHNLKMWKKMNKKKKKCKCEKIENTI